MGVAYFLLLSSLGLAITIQAQECSRPVGGDNMSLKDDDILLQTFPDGTQVTFACDVGYMSAGGSAVITCTAGSWSPVRLRCERRNCGSAGEVENGIVDYPEGTQFGDKLVVTCNTGHRLVGKNQILCGAQGWMSRLPQCEVVTCNPPPTPTNGTFRPIKETYDYREVVQYTCQIDLTLSGSKSSSCSEDGTFKPAPPTCINVQCEDPDIKNADWVEGSRPPHKYQSTVTYQCRSGFTMIGGPILTCGIDGQWSPRLPTCLRITTTAKPTTTTTIRPIITKKPTADPGPTDPPGNNGNTRSIWLGVGLTVLIVSVLTVCGCYFCGVPAIIKEKRRVKQKCLNLRGARSGTSSRRGLPDNVVPKEGEALALA